MCIHSLIHSFIHSYGLLQQWELGGWRGRGETYLPSYTLWPFLTFQPCTRNTDPKKQLPKENQVVYIFSFLNIPPKIVTWFASSLYSDSAPLQPDQRDLLPITSTSVFFSAFPSSVLFTGRNLWCLFADCLCLPSCI